MVHYDAADVSGVRAVCRSTSVAKLWLNKVDHGYIADTR